MSVEWTLLAEISGGIFFLMGMIIMADGDVSKCSKTAFVDPTMHFASASKFCSH